MRATVADIWRWIVCRTQLVFTTVVASLHSWPNDASNPGQHGLTFPSNAHRVTLIAETDVKVTGKQSRQYGHWHAVSRRQRCVYSACETQTARGCSASTIFLGVLIVLDKRFGSHDRNGFVAHWWRNLRELLCTEWNPAILPKSILRTGR
jgi:hypothetical protein